jgi:hypothetical protein
MEAKLEELHTEQLYNFHYSTLIIRDTRTMPKHFAKLGEKSKLIKKKQRSSENWKQRGYRLAIVQREVYIQRILK